jgi:hypothetical protein
LYSRDPSRPNKPVNILISLLILKELNDLTDDELIESLYFDYRFQYALGINDIERDRLCINTLGNFRRRLVEHETEHQVDLFHEEIESLSEHFAEYMQLNKSMARMDSFMLSSSCKKLTRIELVYVVIRNVVRTLDKLNIEVPQDFSPFLKTEHQNKTLYHTRSDKTEPKLNSLFTQAHTLYQYVSQLDVCLQTEAFQHLERLLTEQCVETENGVLVPVEGKNLKSTILQNPSDPDATFRKKGDKEHIGYTVNVVEVRDEDKKAGLILHHDVKQNTYHDTKFGSTFVKEHPLAKNIKTLATDGAYYSQPTLEEAKSKDMEVNFSQMTGRKVSDEKIGVDQFVIDDNLITHCPAGHAVVESIYDGAKEIYRAKFEKKLCEKCPLRAKCPIKEQKDFNAIRFTKNKHQTDLIRSQMGTERHKELSNFRAGVEGVPSALRRGYGIDRIPVRGFVRSKIWVRAKIMAYNFKSMLRYSPKMA